MDALSLAAWDEAYRAGQTGWDIGRAAPPLDRWLRAHPPAGLVVLVPGCGRGHEARLAAGLGAEVTAVDLSPRALDAARRLSPEVSARVRWTQGDVRRLPLTAQGPFDLVIEHTCFCALAPEDRGLYLDELRRVLRPGGRLAGLFYVKGWPTTPPPVRGQATRPGTAEEDPRAVPGGPAAVDFDEPDGPPFGIFQDALRGLLSPRFEIESWEGHPPDSVPARARKEALVVARRPAD